MTSRKTKFRNGAQKRASSRRFQNCGLVNFLIASLGDIFKQVVWKWQSPGPWACVWCIWRLCACVFCKACVRDPFLQQVGLSLFAVQDASGKFPSPFGTACSFAHNINVSIAGFGPFSAKKIGVLHQYSPYNWQRLTCEYPFDLLFLPSRNKRANQYKNKQNLFPSVDSLKKSFFVIFFAKVSEVWWMEDIYVSDEGRPLPPVCLKTAPTHRAESLARRCSVGPWSFDISRVVSHTHAPRMAKQMETNGRVTVCAHRSTARSDG